MPTSDSLHVHQLLPDKTQTLDHRKGEQNNVFLTTGEGVRFHIQTS